MKVYRRKEKKYSYDKYCWYNCSQDESCYEKCFRVNVFMAKVLTLMLQICLGLMFLEQMSLEQMMLGQIMLGQIL
jgi:hypothetical protein